MSVVKGPEGYVALVLVRVIKAVVNLANQQ